MRYTIAAISSTPATVRIRRDVEANSKRRNTRTARTTMSKRRMYLRKAIDTLRPLCWFPRPLIQRYQRIASSSSRRCAGAAIISA